MQLSKLRPRLYPNGRLALELLYEDGEHWGVLTTNLVEAELAVDEVCIHAWQLSDQVLDLHLASGKFEDTGRVEPAGFEDAPVWRVICPELLAHAQRLRAHTR
uniref:Uncharacterized protein n=1 Tax=Pseudomonas monteilii TaxID=76759 RepID=A0A6B7PZX5_9PSED|nr:hypothetical protein [Pseudomonas monteilii]QFX76311.1 hypothetical protein [Pseudomonas monteilii]